MEFTEDITSDAAPQVSDNTYLNSTCTVTSVDMDSVRFADRGADADRVRHLRPRCAASTAVFGQRRVR